MSGRMPISCEELQLSGVGAEPTKALADDNDIELRLLLKDSYWVKLRECFQTSLLEVDARLEHHRHLLETFVSQQIDEQQNKFHTLLSQGFASGRGAIALASDNPEQCAISFASFGASEKLGSEETSNHDSSKVVKKALLARAHTTEFREWEDDRWQHLKAQVHARRVRSSSTLLHGIRSRIRTLGSTQKPPETATARIAQSTTFSAICSALILLNVIFIGYQAEVSVERAFRTPSSAEPDFFKSVNRIFAYTFMLEVVFRIIALRWSFFLGPDWQWNLFDLALVSTSVVEELLNILNLSFFRALRVLRMVRALRMIRVLRFFRELRTMVCSVLYTLSSLAWALILLLLIMYLFSIVFMQATAAYVKDAEIGDATVGEFKKWYATLGGTMYSLFLAISGGADWYEIQKPLEGASHVYSLMFAMYIFFVVFGVLNVLIGVFVERASESSKLDRDLTVHAEQNKMDHLIQEMHDMFDDMPKDANGHVTKEVFKEYIQDEQVKAYLKTRQLDTAAQRLFQVFEATGEIRDDIDCDEFVSGMMRLEGAAKNADIITMLSDVLRLHRKLSLWIQEIDARLPSNPNFVDGDGNTRPTSELSIHQSEDEDVLWLDHAQQKASL